MFVHPKLALAVIYKNPGVVMTCRQLDPQSPNMTLTDFAGTFPTDIELQQWVTEFEALPVNHQAKDPKAAKLKRFDALGQGLQDLKDFIRAEFL